MKVHKIKFLQNLAMNFLLKSSFETSKHLHLAYEYCVKFRFSEKVTKICAICLMVFAFTK